MSVAAIIMMVFGFGVTFGGATLCIRKAMSNS